MLSRPSKARTFARGHKNETCRTCGVNRQKSAMHKIKLSFPSLCVFYEVFDFQFIVMIISYIQHFLVQSFWAKIPILDIFSFVVHTRGQKKHPTYFAILLFIESLICISGASLSFCLSPTNHYISNQWRRNILN